MIDVKARVRKKVTSEHLRMLADYLEGGEKRTDGERAIMYDEVLGVWISMRFVKEVLLGR